MVSSPSCLDLRGGTGGLASEVLQAVRPSAQLLPQPGACRPTSATVSVALRSVLLQRRPGLWPWPPLGPSCSSVGDKAQRQLIGTRRLLAAWSRCVPSLVGQNWPRARRAHWLGRCEEGRPLGVVSNSSQSRRGLAPGSRQNPPCVTLGGVPR